MRVGLVDWVYTVYVIGPSNGPYKIGLARDLRRRLSGLQTGNHDELMVHWDYTLLKRGEARSIERAAHERLKAKRIRGEWFDCTLQEVIDAIFGQLDRRVYVARHMARKDLRALMKPEDIYKVAEKAHESVLWQQD